MGGDDTKSRVSHLGSRNNLIRYVLYIAAGVVCIYQGYSFIMITYFPLVGIADMNMLTKPIESENVYDGDGDHIPRTKVL
jgi:hypothetical protein